MAQRRAGVEVNSQESATLPTGNTDVAAGIRKRAIQIGIQFLIFAAILFLSSGRLDWWFAWAYLGIFVAGVSVNSFVLLRTHPELIAERARQFTPETQKWDRVLATLWGLFSTLVSPLVAALDVRFGWSPHLPLIVQLAAMLFHMFGSAFSGWALVSNAFFAGTVRVQTERGHAVASTGPYHIVRHPGYAGWIVSGLATPLMLGSLWALVPAALGQGALVFRTALEDQTLREELPGYGDYARRVHHRLVPGIW
jgi:protein-S-isoprenylcysteine O-methyltransferase Ste14